MPVKASARHILVATEKECLKLKTDIENGTSFADAAKKCSQCPSGRSGGDLGVPEIKTDENGNPQAKRDFFLVNFSVPERVNFAGEAAEIIQTLKRMTVAEAKGFISPVIRTRAVRSGDTVAALAAQQPFGRYNELFFRAFNGLDDGAQPKAGSWIKYVTAE